MPHSDELVTIEPTGDDNQRFLAYRHLAAYHAKIADRMQQSPESSNLGVVAAIHARAALAQSIAAIAELYRTERA